MKKLESTAIKVGLATAVVTLVTACVYLALAVGSGSTEYECKAKEACSTTVIKRCRKCEVQSSTIAGILGEMRTTAPCAPHNPLSPVGAPSP